MSTAPATKPSFSARVRRRLAFLPRQIQYGYAPLIASKVRMLWVLARNRHADIKFGKGVYLGPGFSLYMPEAATFHVGPGVEFRRNFRAELSGGARVTIGAGTRFTYDPIIQCGQSIEIGEHCMVGQSTLIVDGNHRFRDLSIPMLDQGYDYSPVVLEDHAVLTTKCTVVGARIGCRSYVGAGAVVVEDIPAYSVAVGVPARVVDYFGPDDAVGSGTV
jgi:acetyltransferase-like isoleucine patch superfamily enzyme